MGGRERAGNLHPNLRRRLAVFWPARQSRPTTPDRRRERFDAVAENVPIDNWPVEASFAAARIADGVVDICRAQR